MRTAIKMRKRRTGMWHSMSGGSGKSKTIPDGTGDEFDDGEGEDEQDSDDFTPEAKKKLQNEAKRRRIQARTEKQRANRLQAQLDEAGEGSTGPDTSEVILALVESGMSKDRIRAAVKLLDWSTVSDIEDGIDELREEHPFLFESGPQGKQDLPSQGSAHNSRRRPTQATDAQLQAKYPSLRR